MAATDHGGRRLSSALQALTASALLLPGVQSALAQDTTGDSANVQFSSFSEGRRNTALDTRADPLHAYTVELNATKILPDGNALHVGLLQDSWSGATPVTVAPAAFGGNRPVLVNAGSGTAVAGASPVVNGSLLLDRTLRPVQGGGDELVLSSASPEVRKQVELGYDINAPTRHHAVDAGYSTEPDFRSWHADWHSRFDFNRQQTTLAIGAGYVHSDIDARLDPALLPYLSLDPDSPSYHRNGANVTMQGVRTDRNLSLGLTQVLNHDAVIDISASVEASDGLLSNPYKAMTVLFVPPEALAAGAGTFSADVRALPEQRPDERRQQSVDVRYVQYFGATDAALHVDAGYSHDDWGIASGSIELQWVQPLGNWQLSPRVRWYSQTAADFHAPYLVTPQHFRAIARDSQGRELWHDTANANL
ncbi:MAG TPA: DUF3570 domain-containing protein, partial [Candidatus Acidoferrum sp.]|nr:DUF3570 domain-containing protein [Candidatus Acidoferrum sp.]